MSIFEQTEEDGRLKNIFKAAAAAAVTPALALLRGCLTPLVATFFKPRPKNGRLKKGRLTEGERALLKSIFGKGINTKRIRIYFDSSESPDTPLANTGGPRMVVFNTSESHETDYSQTKNITNYNAFIHEMMHVRQSQHIIPHAANMLRCVYQTLRYPSYLYNYNLWQQEGRLNGRKFGIEQQAQIVGDYAERFLFGGGNGPNARYSESDLKLQKLVEDRFPEARKTRLALEAKSAAAPPPP